MFFCGRKGVSGLQRTSLLKDVTEKLEKEEELAQLLSHMMTSESEAEQASINPEVKLTFDDVQDSDGVQAFGENNGTLTVSRPSGSSTG